MTTPSLPDEYLEDRTIPPGSCVSLVVLGALAVIVVGGLWLVVWALR